MFDDIIVLYFDLELTFRINEVYVPDIKSNNPIKKELKSDSGINGLSQILNMGNKIDFPLLFRTIPGMKYILDSEGKIIDYSENVIDFLLFHNDKIRGLHISDLVAEESTTIAENFAELFSESDKIVENIKVKNYIGITYEIERTYHSIKDENKKITNILVVDVDITPELRTEELLNLHSSALEATALSTVITNIRGDIVWINSAFSELTGYPPEELLYKNVRLLKSGEHPQEFYKELWDTILKGEVWRGELINKRKDGTLYTEEQTITPVKNLDGEISYFVGIKIDITARRKWELKIQKLNEELEERVKVRTKELENVNTQLQNSLTLIHDDMEAGKKIQTRLLPENNKEYGDYTFSHHLTPSLYLSGDFVDYFTINEDNVGFYFADVCGHGASSAFVTIFLKAFMDGYIKKFRKRESTTILNPEILLKKLNADLLHEDLDRHLTIFYGVLNRASNELLFCNCGYFPYPVLHSNDNIISLDSIGSMPLGFYDKAEFVNSLFRLPEHFNLLFISDGILDILPHEHVSQKQSFIEEQLKKNPDSLDNLVKVFSLDKLNEFPDDITFLLLNKKNNNG